MRYILFSLLFIALGASAQDTTYRTIFPTEDGRVIYTKIFEVAGSKTELFGKVKDLMVDAYSSQKAALQSEDKDAGYLAYKGFFELAETFAGGIWKGKPYKYSMWHTIKFYIKDNKVKIVVSDLKRSGFMNTTDPVAIEAWYVVNHKFTNKKKEASARQVNIDAMKEAHAQLENIIEGIGKKLQSAKKSQFDF